MLPPMRRAITPAILSMSNVLRRGDDWRAWASCAQRIFSTWYSATFTSSQRRLEKLALLSAVASYAYLVNEQSSTANKLMRALSTISALHETIAVKVLDAIPAKTLAADMAKRSCFRSAQHISIARGVGVFSKKFRSIY